MKYADNEDKELKEMKETRQKVFVASKYTHAKGVKEDIERAFSDPAEYLNLDKEFIVGILVVF